MRALIVIAALLVPLALAHAAPRKVDPREVEAREAFGAGRYQEALDLYVKLFGEQLHPNYLRNIGRCYQNLGEPDRAISSFREYLRKAKNVSAEERGEIDGYIAEMEELKRTRAAAAAKPPDPAPPISAPPKPVVEPASQPVLVTTAPPAAEPTPLLKRWGFWAVVGGVLAAGAVGAYVVTRAPADPCQPGRVCK